MGLDSLERESSLPKGVDKFDPKEENPKRLKPKTWSYDGDGQLTDSKEIGVPYGPGKVFVVFENEINKFNASDEAASAERLNETGSVATRWFRVIQDIKVLEVMSETSDYVRKRLIEITNSPTNLGLSKSGLEDHSRATVARIVPGFADASMLESLKQKRRIIFEELKALGVKTIHSNGVQVMSSDDEWGW